MYPEGHLSWSNLSASSLSRRSQGLRELDNRLHPREQEKAMFSNNEVRQIKGDQLFRTSLRLYEDLGPQGHLPGGKSIWTPVGKRIRHGGRSVTGLPKN